MKSAVIETVGGSKPELTLLLRWQILILVSLNQTYLLSSYIFKKHLELFILKFMTIMR
jgi:hypothetical protein